MDGGCGTPASVAMGAGVGCTGGLGGVLTPLLFPLEEGTDPLVDSCRLIG